jgi:ribose/xylose/arabinose/galactoside ABC-type transport system permease subunit
MRALHGASLVYLILAILVLFTAIFSPNALSMYGIISILRHTGVLGLIAIGQTFVIIGGGYRDAIGLDVSVGSTVLFTQVFASVLSMMGYSELSVIAFCILLGVLAGLAKGFFVTRGLPPLIATYIMSLLLDGYSYTTKTVRRAGDLITLLGQGRTLNIPNTFLLFVLIAAISYILLHKSVYGRRLFAKSSNPRAAEISGIKLGVLTISTYVICSLFTAIAGLLYYGYMESPSMQFDDAYTVPSLAGVIIGGTGFATGKGTILGSIAGAFLMRFLYNFLASLMAVSIPLRNILNGIIIIAVVAAYEIIRKG